MKNIEPVSGWNLRLLEHAEERERKKGRGVKKGGWEVADRDNQKARTAAVGTLSGRDGIVVITEAK